MADGSKNTMYPELFHSDKINSDTFFAYVAYKALNIAEDVLGQNP